MKKEVKNFKREELFNYYNERSNPFSYVTTRIDVTNLYNFSKKHKNSYGIFGYFFTKAMNEIDEFKYTYENNKIYKCDKINPSFTDIKNDNTIGFYEVDYQDDFNLFIKDYIDTKKRFLNGTYQEEEINDAVVWLSVEPWFNFSGLIPPFDKSICIPQMIWDKFIFENDRVYINLMIMSHHGFVDGYHIGLLINKIKDLINDLKD